MKNILLTILLILVGSCNPIYGQGWLSYYGNGASDLFFDVKETEDNGYLALGALKNPATNIFELYLQKTDIDGNEEWSRLYGNSSDDIFGISLALTNDGGYIIMGLVQTILSLPDESYLLKTDANGIEEWSNQFIYGGFIGSPSEIIQAADGGYLIINNQNNRIWYGKISSLGIEEWSYTILENSQLTSQIFGNIEILPDGYLLGGADKLVKLNMEGEEIWVQSIGSASINNMLQISDGNLMLLNKSSIIGYNLSKRTPDGDEIWNTIIDLDPFFITSPQIIELDDGGFMLVDFNGNSTPVLKVNNNGIEEWKKDIRPTVLFVSSLIKDSSGKLIFAGFEDNGNFIRDALLIKTDQEGNLYTNFITGNIFTDDNQNCNFDDGTEDSFPNRLIQVTGNQTFYGTSDEMGNYNINVDTGNYEVSVIIPNPYWSTCNPQPVSISEFYTDTIIDLATQAVIDCPWLTVDVSTPFLRRCFENNYFINYCNDGTTAAEDAYIEVEFDPFLEVQSSSLPWTTQVGNTYTFDVGVLDPSDCGSFNVRTLVTCDSTMLGQTHCTQAHIFPDSLCLPDADNWDGSSVAVEAECEGDSVYFTIRNIGIGNMLEPLNYIIIEDEIMVHQGDFQLNSGQSQMLPNGYSNSGATYRIVAEQAEGHPGNSIPTAAIEGCGTTIFPFGFFNMFSQNDGDFYLSIDCQENIGSYDPNDKQAFPTGYGDEHYIWQNVDLEYKVRFQNTGTDTAFTVVIRDTISEHLDITSLQMGASSHNYAYTIDGEGVLKVRFDNILLPDSTTNLLGSNGFFKYKIKQQPDNPIGTMIYNKAAIYFDFNAPIITNETYHEVGESFFETTVFTNDLTTNNIKLNVFPNPFGEFTTFEIEDLPDGKTDFVLYDNLGRLVRKESILDDKQFQFYREGLAAGLYFFEFRQAGVGVASGRMVAE